MKKDKFLNIIYKTSIIIQIFAVLIVFLKIHSEVSYINYRFIPNTKCVSFTYDTNSHNYTKTSEIKKDLNKLFEINNYTYIEIENSKIIADSQIFTRIIRINSHYTNSFPHYTIFLAHELTHLKYLTDNELFTNFIAIKTLYESDNNYFQNVALWYAEYLINSQLGDEYDCGYYLLNYFENKH